MYLPYISLISPLYLPGEAELRRKLSCVPQAPHIFSGSLRDNLDPTGAQADRALAKACAQVGLPSLRGSTRPAEPEPEPEPRP